MAVLYALLGIAIGLSMATREDFTNSPVHAHANLVGWVSLAVMGLAYRACPELANNRWAKAQFVLHNVGLPLQLAGLYGLLHAMALGKPMTAIGSMAVACAFAAFAINVWINQRD
jgi:hypothetical protein